MLNIIPFEAGSEWSNTKAKIFDFFFSELHISYAWKNAKDINFVTKLKGLKGLVIESTKSFDLSPVENCTTLKYLNVACGVAQATKLDLSQIPLETYVGKDNIKLKSVYNNDSLRRLTVTGFSYDDMQCITARNLEHITIDGSKSLKSLKGIESLENLKLVEVENCPNLTRPLLYVNDYPFLRIYVDGVLQQ